jgi:3-phosphoshikimate 1-carboxyvinyltransferase
MADLLIHPGQLRGTVVPPPSKSDAHRALIAASLAGCLEQVAGLPPVESADIQATRRCLAALAEGQPLLDCGESGTTLRLLIPVAAALGAGVARPVVFTGHGRLPRRPLDEYRTILSGHGIELAFPPDAFLPLRLRGRLTGGVFRVPGHISSQYISGLLFALPLVGDDSTIELTSPLESAPYVAMTLRTLHAFGVEAAAAPGGFRVPGRQHYQPAAYVIEKDYSQAAFWLVAAFAGSPLQVSGLAADSAQGDQAIIRLLADLARLRETGGTDYTIDVADIPDLVPILAVAAALTPATTRITHAARLRLKESDRLQTTRAALTAIGADVAESGDTLIIRGGRPLRGGEADAAGDHRIAMAMAIAALSTRDGVHLHGAEAVNKSYPDFFRELKRLGGDLDEFHVGSEPENQLMG